MIQQINSFAPPKNSVAIWSLGQHGFVIKGGDTLMCIDPYLSNFIADVPRQFPPPIEPRALKNLSAIFCTHEHADHCDPLTLKPMAVASPQALVVASGHCLPILHTAKIAAERVLVPQVDRTYTLGDMQFTAIPAAHYGLDFDEVNGYRWLGFILTINGVSIYHAGDTIIYDGLVDRLKRHHIDIALLPSNGRDVLRDARGIVGNLLPAESAWLAHEIGADVFIPTHNDLFAGNHLNPSQLADIMDQRYPRQKYHWLQAGEMYVYVK